MGRPAGKDARDTRQEILDAALNLFAEKGFFGTSMREIARAVGVRESAIYHHFVNKDALLDALMADAGEARLLHYEEFMSRVGDLPPRQLLMQLAESMIENWSQPREAKLWRMMMTEGTRLAESGRFEMDVSFRKANDRLHQLFTDLSAQGKIKPISPQLASMEFIAPMFMVRNMSASPKSYKLPEGVTPGKILAAHVAFFCDAIGA